MTPYEVVNNTIDYLTSEFDRTMDTLAELAKNEIEFPFTEMHYKDNREFMETRRDNLQSAITLLQDYQKLREKIDMNKIADIMRKIEYRDASFEYLAEQIVTYLQQPTEPIER